MDGEKWYYWGVEQIRHVRDDSVGMVKRRKVQRKNTGGKGKGKAKNVVVDVDAGLLQKRLRDLV
jgi:hypothetical protein